MSNKSVITITFYTGTPDKPNDQLKKSYALNKWAQEWALRVLLDEIAKEMNYISGYGIWSTKVKSTELNFTVSYKNQFKPCQTHAATWFWNTLRFELGQYVGRRRGKVKLIIPRINRNEGDNLFTIKRSSVGNRKQIRKRGTIYHLHYDHSDPLFVSFYQKLTEGILGPDIQKQWQHYPGTVQRLSWWELPKTQTTQHRAAKRRKHRETEARKLKKLEKEGVVYKDKRKKKKAQQVYVVQVNHESMPNVYKIGISNAPGKRLQALNTSNPFELDILHKFVAEPAEEAEAKLHKRFEQTRLSGEWFQLTDTQVSEICKIVGYADGKFITEQDEVPLELTIIQRTEKGIPSKTINYKGVELMAIQNFGLGFNAQELNLEDVLWLYEHNQNHKDIYVVTLSGRISGNLLDFKDTKSFNASLKFNDWNSETMQCVDELVKRFDLNNQQLG